MQRRDSVLMCYTHVCVGPLEELMRSYDDGYPVYLKLQQRALAFIHPFNNANANLARQDAYNLATYGNLIGPDWEASVAKYNGHIMMLAHASPRSLHMHGCIRV